MAAGTLAITARGRYLGGDPASISLCLVPDESPVHVCACGGKRNEGKLLTNPPKNLDAMRQTRTILWTGRRQHPRAREALQVPRQNGCARSTAHSRPDRTASP